MPERGVAEEQTHAGSVRMGGSSLSPPVAGDRSSMSRVSLGGGFAMRARAANSAGAIRMVFSNFSKVFRGGCLGLRGNRDPPACPLAYLADNFIFPHFGHAASGAILSGSSWHGSAPRNPLDSAFCPFERQTGDKTKLDTRRTHNRPAGWGCEGCPARHRMLERPGRAVILRRGRGGGRNESA